MKEEIKQLMHEYMAEANEEELNILKDILEGLARKQNKLNSTYLGGIFQMSRTASERECIVTIPLSPLANNPLGITHGGIISTLIDSAMGTLANTVLPEGYGAVTSQLNVHFLAPGIGDSLTCKASIEHQGSKSIVLTADVFRPDGKKIAYATSTFFILKAPGK